jgi:hypothetical protein
MSETRASAIWGKRSLWFQGLHAVILLLHQVDTLAAAIAATHNASFSMLYLQLLLCLLALLQLVCLQMLCLQGQSLQTYAPKEYDLH